MSFRIEPSRIDFRVNSDAEDTIYVYHSQRLELLAAVREDIPYFTEKDEQPNGLVLKYGASRFEFNDNGEVMDIIKLGVDGSTWKGAAGTFYDLNVLCIGGGVEDNDTVQISRGGGGGGSDDARSLIATFIGSRITIKKFQNSGLASKLVSGPKVDKDFLTAKPKLPPKGVRCLCGTKIYSR